MIIFRSICLGMMFVFIGGMAFDKIKPTKIVTILFLLSWCCLVVSDILKDIGVE